MANLAFGVLGILCGWLRGALWTATVIGVAIWGVGDGVGHVYELVVHNNHSPYNSGAIMYLDILVPLIAIALLVALWAAGGHSSPRGASQGV